MYAIIQVRVLHLTHLYTSIKHPKRTSSKICLFFKAANYMDIEDLLKRSCTEVALRIEGKSSAEMRGILGIPNDWKSEDKNKLEKESGMLFEKK